MRLQFAVYLTLSVSLVASGQTYTISTLAGGAQRVNIPGTSTSLYFPQSVAVDSGGNLFITNENTVLRLDVTTDIVTLVAGNGTTGFSGDDGLATSAQLSRPAHSPWMPLATFKSGTLIAFAGSQTE